MRGSRFFLVIVPVLALAAACSSGVDQAPGETVQEFYRHLNEGDYPSALALYNTAALEILEDSDDSSFSSWARLTTKDGTVRQVDVVDLTSGEGTANVEFKVVYADGSTEQHTVELTMEEGQWKLGFIS